MFVFIGVTVGFFTTDVGVVLVVGVSVVLVVTAGLTAGLTVGVVTFGVVTFGVVVFVGVVVLDVSVGLVVKGTLGASVVFGVRLGFVVKDAGGLTGKVGFGADNVGLFVEPVTVEVTGGRFAPPAEVAPVVRFGREPSEVKEPEGRPVNEGRSLKLRMTLSSGARSSPLASGICLLDVRFLRIAMSYPVFFSIDVKPAILVTGLSFAVLASVFAGIVAF